MDTYEIGRLTGVFGFQPDDTPDGTFYRKTGADGRILTVYWTGEPDCCFGWSVRGTDGRITGYGGGSDTLDELIACLRSEPAHAPFV